MITTFTPKKKKYIQNQFGVCANINVTQDIPEGTDSLDGAVGPGVPDEQDEREKQFTTTRQEASAKYRAALKEFFAKRGSLWSLGFQHIICPKMKAEQSSSRYSEDLDWTKQSCSPKCVSTIEKIQKKKNPEMTTKIKIEPSMADCNVMKLQKLRGPRGSVTEDPKRSKV